MISKHETSVGWISPLFQKALLIQYACDFRSSQCINDLGYHYSFVFDYFQFYNGVCATELVYILLIGLMVL